MEITGKKLHDEIVKFLDDEIIELEILVRINNILGLYCVNSYDEIQDKLDVN
jgi:hypothetical protein